MAKETLEKIVSATPGVEIIEDEDAACEVISKSFAGNAEKDGMQLQYIILGPEYKANESRENWCKLMAHVEWGRIVGEDKGGICLGLKEGGKLIAVCIARRLSNGPIVESGLKVEDKVTSDAISSRLDLLPDKDLQGICDRMKSAAELCSFFRVACNPGPYWFVSMCAVLPEYQDKGHGPKLMNVFHACADEDDFPCYLEASSIRNRARFQKGGYINLLPQIESRMPGNVRMHMKDLVNPNTGRLTDWSFMVKPSKSRRAEAQKIPDLQNAIKRATELGVRASVAAHVAIQQKLQQKENTRKSQVGRT